MRKTILATLTVLALGGATTGILVANAQPAPPPIGMDGPAARPHWGGMARPGHDGQRAHAMRRMRNFALVYPQQDRKLTPPDVQKIAEAFLLWHGNHTWKVVEVAPATDGAIGFGLATPDGSVIARFTMDARTARVTRVG
ncbi:MAG: hypothetical protein WDN25_24475 [Acetobacteraceae bacterium]